MKNILKNHIHHIILAITILSLTAQLIWWFIFLQQSITTQYSLKEQNLVLQMDRIAEQFRHGERVSPQPGILENDTQFEILPKAPSPTPIYRSIKSGPDSMIIRIRPQVLAALKDEFSRKKVMIFGESSFLAVIILLGFIFLYNYVRLERRANREVKKFWERVTHELKTPLTGVKAYIESVTPENMSSPRFWEMRDQALKLAHAQEAQIERMLDISKIKQQHTRLKCRSINLNRWLDDFLTTYMAGLQKVDIKIRQTGETIRIKANPSGLKIILDNILDNAIKYCPQPIVLSLTTGFRKRRAIISITDNGPGVEPRFAKKIFEAYKSVDCGLPLHKHGSGMGLSIARDVARKMGGDLQAGNLKERHGLELQLFLKLD